jgi:hypothetical protein
MANITQDADIVASSFPILGQLFPNSILMYMLERISFIIQKVFLVGRQLGDGPFKL